MASAREIKVKVRAQETIRFPGVCVHCLRPASVTMPVEKRNSRTVRSVDVPICARCAAVLGRESAEEERLRKLGRLVAAVAGVATLLLTLLLLPAGANLWARLTAGTLAGLIVAGLVFALSRRSYRQAALPEKQAIRDAARLADFSWRTATFVFENATFADRFAQLNESLLMEP